MRMHSDDEIYEEARKQLPDPKRNEGQTLFKRVYMDDDDGLQHIYTAKFTCIRSDKAFGYPLVWEEKGIQEYGVTDDQ